MIILTGISLHCESKIYNNNRALMSCIIISTTITNHSVHLPKAVISAAFFYTRPHICINVPKLDINNVLPV